MLINCFTYRVKKGGIEIAKGYIHAQSKNGAMSRFNQEKASDLKDFDHVEFIVTKCTRCFSTDDVAHVYVLKQECVFCRDCRMQLYQHPIKFL